MLAVLKIILNHKRPESARESNKSDPGMPSSHAQSLAYLGAYAAIVLCAHPSALHLATTGLIAAVSLFLAWLRVELGLHSVPQVAVGYLVGCVNASVWYALGRRWVLGEHGVGAEVVWGGLVMAVLRVVVEAGRDRRELGELVGVKRKGG